MATAEKITIITVVYNSENEIDATIKSVLSQDYGDIEYIVIDGASADGTLSIIEENKHDIDIIVSEEDDGIYHAMNKGIRLSSGAWVGFMNAGDVFCHSNVLSSLMKDVNSDTQLAYGDRYLVYPDGRRVLQKALDLECIYHRMPFGHQALLVRSSCMKNGFSVFYKYVSDYAFVIDCFNKGYRFQYINMPICDFKLGGESQVHHRFVALEAMYMLLRVTGDMDIVKNSVFYKSFSKEICADAGNNIFSVTKGVLRKIFKYARAITRPK